MDTLWQYLMQGDLIGLVVAIYTARMGEYFFGFMIFLFSVPLYIRTQSLTYVLVLWILIMPPLLIYLVPIGAYKIIGVLLTVALGGLLYLVIGRLRS